MEEFFNVLNNEMFARIFIFCEVWFSFTIGYLVGKWERKGG